MFQTKERDKTPEEQLSEVEIDNLLEKDSRIMKIKVIQDFGKRIEAQTEKILEMFNEELEDLKNKQGLNKTITEMKNTQEGMNSKITEAEEWINEMEDRMLEFTAMEQNKEKIMKRSEDSLGYLWENIKCSKIRIIRVPE